MFEMPKQRPKWSPLVVVLGLFITVYVVNFMFAYVGWSPFLYCKVGPLVAPAYWAWEGIVSIIAAFVGIFAIGTKRYGLGLMACLVLVVAIGLPQYMDTLFRWGGSCG